MRKIKYTVAWAVLVFAVAGTASAGVTRVIDFEDGRTGSIGSNSHLTVSGNAPTVVRAENGVSPRAGSYMMRSYLNRETSSTNFRTEATVNSPGTFEKGKEYWLGISVFVPADWRMDYGGEASEGIVWQFHGRSYKDPSSIRKILPMTVMHTQSGWKVRNHVYQSHNNSLGGLGNLPSMSKTVPYKLGQWNDFVVNVKFSGAQSKNDTNGFMRVWVNGSKVIDHNGQNFFGEHEGGPYFKFGLYNATWKYTNTWKGPSSRLLYHDEFRIGDASSSYNQVAPGGGSQPQEPVSAPPSPPRNLQAQ